MSWGDSGKKRPTGSRPFRKRIRRLPVRVVGKGIYFVSALRRALRTFTSASAPATAARALACRTSAWSNSRFTWVISSGMDVVCGGRAELADDLVCDDSVAVLILFFCQPDTGDD